MDSSYIDVSTATEQYCARITTVGPDSLSARLSFVVAWVVSKWGLTENERVMRQILHDEPLVGSDLGWLILRPFATGPLLRNPWRWRELTAALRASADGREALIGMAQLFATTFGADAESDAIVRAVAIGLGFSARRENGAWIVEDLSDQSACWSEKSA